MCMRRRTILAGLAGGLGAATSGILFEKNIVSNNIDSRDALYSAETRVTPEGYPLKLNSTIIQENFQSPDAPFVLELTIRNDSEVPLGYGDSRRVVFQRGSSDQGFYTLNPEQHSATWDDESRLWRVEGPLVFTADFQYRVLKPFNEHSVEVVVLYHPEDDAPDALPEELVFEVDYTATVESDTDNCESDGVTATNKLILESE